MTEAIFALIGVGLGYFLCWIKIEKKETQKKVEKVKQVFINDIKKGQITSPTKILRQKELDDI